MEVSRNMGPEPGFLQSVRQLASDKGIVLIFDECTSGFRQTFGGLHTLYGVEPDMAMFGKALGNGYAITAAIGKREVMEAAQTHVHQQHLLDRAHRSDRCAQDAGGDGAGAILGADHRDRTRTSPPAGRRWRESMACRLRSADCLR